MSDSNKISYLPSDNLTYDPRDPVYWDSDALQQEIDRTFEICHGCRMCFKYCDSFADLFRFLDERHDGDVRKITSGERDGIMASCFQCKLCEVQCPYTPRDGHEFQLDFPRLVHRHQAQRVRRRGQRLRDRILAAPDKLARMARASLGLVNVANRVGIHRWFLEKFLGIHRRKLLPGFASTTFESWARKEGRTSAGPGGEAVLFQTCYVQNNEPGIGRDALEVMDRNGVDCRCAGGLTCCGMPAWEHGDLESLRAMARTNLDVLMPHVEKGAKVLAINPTCSMMMRREYPELLEGEDRERASKLAGAVMDPGEFLWSIRKEDRFNTDFKSTPGPVAYHAPCHLKAQSVGFKGRDLIRRIPGTNPETVMECCGHNGTFAMKVEGFDPSRRVGRRAFEGMSDSGAQTWSSECPLAALQFRQHTGNEPLHPMTILARAYREDGFETPVSPTEDVS